MDHEQSRNSLFGDLISNNLLNVAKKDAKIFNSRHRKLHVVKGNTKSKRLNTQECFEKNNFPTRNQ